MAGEPERGIALVSCREASTVSTMGELPSPAAADPDLHLAVPRRVPHREYCRRGECD